MKKIIGIAVFIIAAAAAVTAFLHKETLADLIGGFCEE